MGYPNMVNLTGTTHQEKIDLYLECTRYMIAKLRKLPTHKPGYIEKKILKYSLILEGMESTVKQIDKWRTEQGLHNITEQVHTNFAKIHALIDSINQTKSEIQIKKAKIGIPNVW